MILLLIGFTSAQAGPLHVVREGETIETIAADAGGSVSADAIRRLNGLGATAQPAVGSLVKLPDLAGPQAEQQGWFTAIVGKVTVQPFGAPAAPASLYDLLPANALLCTGPASYAGLRVATQCTAEPVADDLTLAPDSCVRIESAFSAPGMRSSVVRVLSGSIAVQSTDAGGSVTVLSEGAVTTGRAGGYRVTVEDARSRTEALYAAVAVAAEGEQVDLDAGQGVQVIDGQPPSEPVDLLPPGQPLRPEAAAPLLDPSFAWTPVADAFGYRLEIGADPAFREVLYADSVPRPSHAPQAMLLPWPSTGLLFWRVSSFDRMGFLGIPSDPRAVRLPRSE